ncbi:hypothetical protein JCM3774_004008 [Rhodotorula dairenensis]
MHGVAVPTSPLLESRQNVPPSPRSSGFVLLTTATADASALGSLPHLIAGAGSPARLARPRWVPVLQLAAILDLVLTLALAHRVPISALPPSTLVINLARSVVVGTVASSSRIRELGPIVLIQLAVTALVLLYRLNELVQTNAAGSSSPTPRDAVPDVLNATTEWYLASFGLSCLHYLLYAAFVGFARERNPLAGRMKRSATWGEQRWEGTQVAVDGATLAGSIRSRSSDGGYGSGSGTREDRDESAFYNHSEEEAGDRRTASEVDDDDDGFSSDDIVDVPRRYHGTGLTAATGPLRHRASQRSLLSVSETARNTGRQPTSSPPRSRAAMSGMGAVRNYGSINSLAGI